MARLGYNNSQQNIKNMIKILDKNGNRSVELS